MVVTNGLPRSGARRSVAQQSEAPRPWAAKSEILAGVDSHHPAAGPDAAVPGAVYWPAGVHRPQVPSITTAALTGDASGFASEGGKAILRNPNHSWLWFAFH